MNKVATPVVSKVLAKLDQDNNRVLISLGHALYMGVFPLTASPYQELFWQ